MKHDHDYEVFISFYFICVYRARVFRFLVFHIQVRLLLVWLLFFFRSYYYRCCGFGLLLGIDRQMLAQNNGFTVCICGFETERAHRTAGLAYCTKMHEQTWVDFILSARNEMIETISKKFRNICAVSNYAEVLTFRWPFGCNSCMYLSLRWTSADYNFVDVTNSIAEITAALNLFWKCINEIPQKFRFSPIDKISTRKLDRNSSLTIWLIRWKWAFSVI